MVKRPRVIKSTVKAASGGVIVVAALLALIFFKGPGLGTGEGTEENPAMATTASPANEEPAAPASDSPAVVEDDGGLTEDEKKALSGNVLAVLIDEHEFRMALPGDAGTIYREVEFTRLLELAQEAEGDSNGIRVRILRRENARASAEERLKRELFGVGVKTNAIYMPADFVP